MIDPNIWNSEDFAQLSPFAKLVFIGLFSQADDEGRGRAKPAYLKSILFPYDEEITAADVEKALREIEGHMSATFYTHGEKEYYVLRSWKRFQTINKPTASAIPLPEGYGSDPAALPPNKNRKEEKEREEKGDASPFRHPSQSEVRAYCAERGGVADPEQFFDFYTSKGWKIGNQPMKDWKAALRTWERRTREGAHGDKRGFPQREYTEAEIEKRKAEAYEELEALYGGKSEVKTDGEL